RKSQSQQQPETHGCGGGGGGGGGSPDDLQKRRAHSQSEQRRRNSIKAAYAELAALTGGSSAEEPAFGSGEAPLSPAGRASRAATLQAAISHFEALMRQRDQLDRQLAALRKQTEAARLINRVYQRRVSRDGGQSAAGASADAAKLAVFRHVADHLAGSFASRLGATADCGSLLDGVLDWLDDCCSPGQLAALGEEAVARHLATPRPVSSSNGEASR
ncbi:hypothetical protein BOX15_Mlig010891g2, partial [Macrostomum lignano]